MEYNFHFWKESVQPGPEDIKIHKVLNLFLRSSQSIRENQRDRFVKKINTNTEIVLWSWAKKVSKTEWSMN